MPIEPFAQALGRIPSGIFVITAKRGDEEAALLASWVQQASFEPPTIMLAVHKDRPIDPLLQEHGAFAVHVLSKEDKDLYSRFAKGGNAKPFEGLKTEAGRQGSPILLDAHAAMECRVRTRVDAGDHHVIVADVLDGRLLNEGEPRVHIRKNGLSY